MPSADRSRYVIRDNIRLEAFETIAFFHRLGPVNSRGRKCCGGRIHDLYALRGHHTVSFAKNETKCIRHLTSF
jgi:hypothetical protein